MRTLIIADVHANLNALTALPDADVILCAGDVVTFGVEPNECIDWLATRRVVCIRGEEDDAVAHGAHYELPHHLARAGIASRSWTRSVLTPERKDWLSALPPEAEFVVDRRRIALVHAYPGDYNCYLLPTEDELDRITRAFPRADLIVAAHTHRQGVWRHRDKIVVNPGSVGQSAQPGLAAYVLYDGGVTFGTARYDVDGVVEKIRKSSLTTDVQGDCIRELVRGSVRPSSRLPAVYSASA
jgi:predicted phosphodiesterase